jgi:hypothetical protein
MTYQDFPGIRLKGTLGGSGMCRKEGRKEGTFKLFASFDVTREYTKTTYDPSLKGGKAYCHACDVFVEITARIRYG